MTGEHKSGILSSTCFYFIGIKCTHFLGGSLNNLLGSISTKRELFQICSEGPPSLDVVY